MLLDGLVEGLVDPDPSGALPVDRVEDRLLLIDVMANGGPELAEEDGSLLPVVPFELLAALQQRFELPMVP